MPTWLLVLVVITSYLGIGIGVSLAAIRWLDMEADDAAMCIIAWPLTLLILVMVLPVDAIYKIFKKAKEQMEKERNQK